MEAEKIYQEKTVRTIQQKQDGSGALQFVDNRPMNQVLQRAGEDEEDASQTKADTTLQQKPNDAGMLVNDNGALEHEADVMGAKVIQTVSFPIQRIVNLYRSSYVWKTPYYDQDVWHRGQQSYQAPTSESKAVTDVVSKELLDGQWISGHMVNGTLAGGHGGPDNIEPITAGLNHSMTILENPANAAARNDAMEYKYMMEGLETHTWSRDDSPDRKVNNLITKYKGTLCTRTRPTVTPGRSSKDQYGQWIHEPDTFSAPGRPNIDTREWQMDVRPGIVES